MGTPEFALPSFAVTRERTDLALVVTQPDRPAGRGRKLTPPPVKLAALEAGVEVAQPEASLTRELGPRLVELAPDLVVVAAFGKFLGRKVLELPRHGCVNVHASLLPRHRGASPIAWAILAGDRETGVTIQRMVPEMDAGDVLAQARTAIDPDETTGELAARLSELGASALGSVLDAFEAGTARAVPQDHSGATLAPPFDKRAGRLDWSAPARRVHDHVRAMNPWPVAWTSCHKGALRVLRTRVVEEDEPHAEPGLVLDAGQAGIVVACGRGAVAIVEGQREGRGVCRAGDLVAGRTVCGREVLGA